MFDPYHQRDRTRGSRGLGLGLTLVKSLVEAHGGTISVRSDGPGTGSEFTFTLPRTSAAPAAAAATSDRPERRRILVVDDQPDVADSFASMLEALGHEVRVAYAAERAVTMAREVRPAVAFLEIWMPGTGGAELARRLRQEFSASELMLVAITGLGRNAIDADAPFDHHVLKPLSPEEVSQLLNASRSAGRDA